MSDLEAPRESALLEAKQVRIGDLIQSAVAEDLGDYHEVVTTRSGNRPV